MDRLTANLEAQLTPYDALINQCVAALATAFPQQLDPTTKILIKNLDRKLKENKGILVKVDKGQSLVIMDRQEYDQLMKFLNNAGAHCWAGCKICFFYKKRSNLH